jgi:molecular chaperone DnaK (HSP70)
MKKLVLSILLVVGFCFTALAQDVSMCVYLPKNTEIPEASMRNLQTQLEKIATQNGNADFAVCDRFILTAKVDVLQKDIVAGPPQRISQTVNITLQVGDVVENKLYASYAFTAVGIGTNLTKAYMDAFKRIQKNDKQIADFMLEAKKKIIQYYAQQCEKIYTDANNLAKRQQYDEAIYQLACVPDIGSECYARCQDALVEIYQDKINAEGRQSLNKAQTVWAKTQNEEGAKEATAYLQQINPNADCQDKVAELINEISSKIRQDQEQAWQFQLQQYNDMIQQEREAARNVQELRKMGIQAAKEIAVAYAKNQPKKDYYIIW